VIILDCDDPSISKEINRFWVIMKKSPSALAWGIVIISSFLMVFAPGLRADDASRLKAAQDLLVAAQMDQIFSKTIDEALDMQIKQAPQLADLRDVMKAFFVKYMSWDAMKDDLAKSYADAFTEQELKEITKFYRTPAGKKMALMTPDLMTREANLGQQKVQDHIGELQQMIQEAMEKKKQLQGQ